MNMKMSAYQPIMCIIHKLYEGNTGKLKQDLEGDNRDD